MPERSGSRTGKTRRARLLLTALVLAVLAGIAVATVDDRRDAAPITPSQVRQRRVAGETTRVRAVLVSLSRSGDAATLSLADPERPDTPVLDAEYRGSLPEGLREGSTVVVTGLLDNRGVFRATDAWTRQPPEKTP